MRKLLPIAGIAALLYAAPASAISFTTFTDRSAWEAAVGVFMTEDFESASPVEADTGGDTFVLDDFEIVIDENHGDIEIGSSFASGSAISGAQSFHGDVHGPNDDPPLFQIFNFNSPIVAFGGDFANGDSDGVTIHVDGQTFALSFDDPVFFGLVGDGSFSSFEIRGGDTGDGYYILDDLSYASSAVPAPAPLGLLGVAFLALGAARVRARRRTA